MPIDRLTILGAGGHGRVVYDALLAAGLAERVEIRDDRPGMAGFIMLGCPVIVPIGPLEALSREVHVAIGSNRVRADLAVRSEDAGCTLESVVHPRACMSLTAELGTGSFVAAGAVVAPAARTGKCAIINHGAVVDHDCLLGAWVHVAPNATLGGGVEVGDGALIGAGAVVLPGLSVGAWAVVGAGAVVTRPVRAGETVMGVPAGKRASV